MSKHPIFKTIDDLSVKTKRPNHLASTTEKQAAAGATLPKPLVAHYQQLQQLTQLVRQALAELLPEQMLDDCYVVEASLVEITLSLGSPTAVNHMRYMMVNCVQALRSYDQRFCQLMSIQVILSPKPTQSDARQDDPKRTLSENTRQIITQSAQSVIKNERLRAALLKLAGNDN